MIFSILRKFFTSLANLFSPKSASLKPQIPVKPQSKTRSNQLASRASNATRRVTQTVSKTVVYAAQTIATRTEPTLVIINTRFSQSKNKYSKNRDTKKLVAKRDPNNLHNIPDKYAVGRIGTNWTSLQVMAPERAIFIDNPQVSGHHLSIERETDSQNKDKYFLIDENSTNGTFKREPLWKSLLFWQNSSDYQNKPMWIPFFNWKCKRIKKKIELRHGDVLVLAAPTARDPNGQITNPILKFVYPPIWYVRLGIFVAKGLLTLILIYILACWLLIKSVDDVVVEPLPSSPAPLAIYANDNKTLMAGGQATPHQEKKQLTEFPRLLVQTLIESEDQNFYFHAGINPFRIFTTALENLRKQDIVAGASTIDQQLARTLFSYDVNAKDIWGKKINYDPEKGRVDTFDRKIREAGIALKINSTYRNKDSILLAYMNSVDLGYRNTGEGIRGFSDASLFYFNKPVENLLQQETKDQKPKEQDPKDIARITNLVALLRAPALAQSLCDRRIEPSEKEIEDAREAVKAKKGNGKSDLDNDKSDLEKVRDNVIDLQSKRNTLINVIRDRGYISSDVAAKAKKLTNYTLFNNTSGFCQGADLSEDYYKFSPVFMSERVREELRQVLSITKQDEKDRGRGVFDNYIVVASLDVDKQNNARRILAESVERLWNEKAVPHGALITINPKNGEILALAGEIKSHDQKYQYDYAATELIPPASTFKMFFYTAALKGGLPMNRVYNCAPLEYEGDSFPLASYSSYCAAGNRTIDLRTAVSQSDNVIPLRAVKDYASLGQVVETAQSMGIRSNLEPPTPRMAYGQYRTILREMVGAYAVLANGGKYNFPHAIRAIYLNTNKGDCDSTAQKFSKCELLYKYEQDVRAEKQVISKDIADKMTELLRGVVSEGTGRSADIRSIIGKDIAGKTGTSGDNQDGWFIGYIPNELATGVWLGNFVHPALVTNPPPSGSFNSADAAWLWGDYMKVCHLAKGCSK